MAIAMIPTSGMKALWAPAFAVALLCVGVASAADTGASAAAALRAKYGAMQDQLSVNQFQRPLYLESNETPGGIKGDVYALVNHPFTTTGAALKGPARWCDILILHLNTKLCIA